ncbi:MAG TPA: hypothetical protein VGL76_09740 [Gaiellaceae bacterium]
MRASLLAFVFAVALLSTGAATAAMPGIPSLYVTYNPDCTFSLAVDPGTAITATSAPGPALPPGKYDLTTYMDNPSSGYPCGKPSFALSGPGVSVQILFPSQAIYDERLITLQPSSNYVAQDQNAPSTTMRFFSTAATGSSTSLLPAKTPSTAKTSGSTQPDIIGSGISHVRGTLVVAGGVVKLQGRRVRTLKAGRYELRVTVPVTVRRGRAKPVTVRHSKQLSLTAGAWTFATTGKAASVKVG